MQSFIFWDCNRRCSAFFSLIPLLHKCYQRLQQVTGLIFMHINDCSSERSLGTTMWSTEPSLLSASFSALKKKKNPWARLSYPPVAQHGAWTLNGWSIFQKWSLVGASGSISILQPSLPVPISTTCSQNQPQRHSTKPSLGASYTEQSKSSLLFEQLYECNRSVQKELWFYFMLVQMLFSCFIMWLLCF